jgi:hypothetical protein
MWVFTQADRNGRERALMKLMSTYQPVTLPRVLPAVAGASISRHRGVGSDARRFVECGASGRFDGVTIPFTRVLPVRDHRCPAD